VKTKPKIFSIGGATFDIFIKAHDQAIIGLRSPLDHKEWLCLEYGGKVKIDEVHETYGGGATNTSVAFSRMGFDAYFIGMVGTEYGDKVLENLRKEKVHAEYVSRTTKDKTAFSTILNTFEGDRTVLAYAGANQYFSADDLPLKALGTADWIFFNHLTEKKSRIPDELLKILKKNPKIRLAWNPGLEQIEQGTQPWKPLLDRTDLLFMNKEEAVLFARTAFKPAGIKHENPKFHWHIPHSHLPPYADDMADVFSTFLKTGVKTVVITDGKNGSQACDRKRVYFCPVETQKKVDTLGAGDAYASGFTSAIILGLDIQDALKCGTINSNSVISYFGAQRGLLTQKELLKRLQKIDLMVTSTKLE